MRIGWGEFNEKHTRFWSLFMFLLSSSNLYSLSTQGSWMTLIAFVFCFSCAVSISHNQMKIKESRVTIGNNRRVVELIEMYNQEINRLQEIAHSNLEEVPEEINNSLYISDKRLLRKLDNLKPKREV